MSNVLADLFQDIADAIRAKTGSTDKMAPATFPTEIGAISAGSGDVSGVNAALDAINGEMIGAKTVTYMVEGTVYATKLVAPGDTASRPANPTKVSTVSEVFTFAGWSLEDDGTVDSDALKNVTEDRTVYAVFTASPRPYTVSFYDDDGAFLNSEQVPYGGSASDYTPEKKGALFQNWSPEPINITGDLDCYAVWHYVAFTNDDWATIKAVAQTHNAEAVYSLGEERELTIYPGGPAETVLLEVAEFNPGVDLVDGDGNVTGTAGMTVRLKTPLATALSYMGGDWAVNTGATLCYPESAVYAYLRDTILPALPAELQAVLSAARREYEYYAGIGGIKTNTADLTLWILSEDEAEAMAQADRIKAVYGTETPVNWHLMSLNNGAMMPDIVLNTGAITTYIGGKDAMNAAAYYIVFEFYL